MSKSTHSKSTRTAKSKSLAVIEHQAQVVDDQAGPLVRMPNGQFAPGNPGYPKNRPKGSRYISESLKLLFASTGEDGRSGADRIADALFAAAVAGDVKAIEMAMEKVEGKESKVSHHLYKAVDDEKENIITFGLMASEMVDRDQAIKIRAELAARKLQEKQKTIRWHKNRFKALQKAIDAAEQAVAGGNEADVEALYDIHEVIDWGFIDQDDAMEVYAAKIAVLDKSLPDSDEDDDQDENLPPSVRAMRQAAELAGTDDPMKQIEVAGELLNKLLGGSRKEADDPWNSWER